MPEVDPAVPASEWLLGERGRAAARELGSVMPAEPAILSSPNPKTRQTAEQLHTVAGGILSIDDRLIEVQRANIWLEDYKTVALSYVLGELPPGWEPHEQVAARLSSAVAQARARAQGRPVVLVGHGLSTTVWLNSQGKLEDPAAFWSELRFPDAWRTDQLRPIRLT